MFGVGVEVSVVEIFVYIIPEMGVIPLKPLFQLSYIIFLS